MLGGKVRFGLGSGLVLGSVRVRVWARVRVWVRVRVKYQGQGSKLKSDG